MNRRRFVAGLVGTGLVRGNFAEQTDVRQVLVMFKCHLDVGFVDTQAAIIRKYFTQFYPRAIAIAETMRNANPDTTAQTPYIWTTGSWLLYRYLEQAGAQDRKRMEDAILRGDIAWHALPFTWQTELLDQSFIKGCVGFSKKLDARFGRTTTGAKMTDVPGHSRGLIAPLFESGVTFLDIGVNSASTAPQVPPVFVWKNAAGASLIVMYHRTDYGGVVRIPQSNLAIAVEVRDDNTGPHTAEEIRKIYSDLRVQFPNAQIRAADLTAIANAVKPHEPALPVMTEEIGDTWIYGIPSDPLKMARFREVLRLRRGWIASNKLAAGDKIDLAMLADAALTAEHTWGTDTKTWLDFDNYTPASLRRMLDNPKYQTVTSSWVEKRANLEIGVANLPPSLRAEAQARLAALKPQRPNTEQRPQGLIVNGTYYTIELDAATGAITKLRDEKTQRDWASPQNPIALFTYQTLSKADYDRFIASYITVQTDWAPKDFGKPNIQNFGAESRSWGTKLIGSYAFEDADSHRLIAQLQVDAQPPTGTTAFPTELWLAIVLPKAEPLVELTLSWFGKAVNRLPEAFWLTFQPISPSKEGWTMTKVEEVVSPFDVVKGGNRHMHALSTGLNYRDANGAFAIETLDAPVVSLGERSPIFFSNEQPDLTRGLHFSLFNNGWGTNYVQWYGEDAQFRFHLRGS